MGDGVALGEGEGNEGVGVDGEDVTEHLTLGDVVDRFGVCTFALEDDGEDGDTVVAGGVEEAAPAAVGEVSAGRVQDDSLGRTMDSLKGAA